MIFFKEFQKQKREETMHNHKKLTPRVWLVTGTSHGFGHELVKAILKRGDRVIATSRNPEKMEESFPYAGDQLLVIALNFHDQKQATSTLQKAIDHFGRIDVLINNAGHGLLGAIEEASDAEIARIYETNVFGLIRVTRAVLPYMRRQESGNIVNISSIVGLVGLPGWGIYSSTKFAIEGLSESLAAEVSPLGINVTIVEPGPFRTDFLGKSLLLSETIIPDYIETTGEIRASAHDYHGKQEGDPALAAKAIIQAVTSDKPPLHLLLGEMAYTLANNKLDALRSEYSKWRDIALDSDYPK